MRLRRTLDGIASIALIGASIAILWSVISRPRAATRPTIRTAAEPSLPREPITIQGAAQKGSLSAPLVLIVFSDFECPFCVAFTRDTLPKLTAEFVDTGKTLLVFRHFPLQQIHPRAFDTARAAVCAGIEGKFWPFHDEAFKD